MPLFGGRPQGSISAYQPTLADIVQNRLASGLSALGLDERHSQRIGGKLSSALNALTPLGNANDLHVAYRDARHGNILQALTGGTMAVAPIPAPVRKAILKNLTSPSILSTPRPPTASEMSRFGRVQKVPLSRARAGNRLEPERFNRGNYGEPLVPGYSDKPLAVQLENGEFVLLDGNHRAALANGRKKTSMEMHVIRARDYDPANAGRRPSADKLSTDELMAALGMLE